MGGHDTDQLTLESQSLNADSSPNRLVFSSHKCPVCDLFMEEHRLDKDCCRACEIRKKYGFKSFSGCLHQRKEEDARLTAGDMGGHDTDQLTSESQSLNADSPSGRLVLSSHKCPICCGDCVLRKKYGFISFSEYLQQRMEEDARLTEEETSGEIVDNGSDLPGKKLWLRHFLMTAGIAAVAAIFMGFQNNGGKKRAGSTQR